MRWGPFQEKLGNECVASLAPLCIIVNVFSGQTLSHLLGRSQDRGCTSVGAEISQLMFPKAQGFANYQSDLLQKLESAFIKVELLRASTVHKGLQDSL